MKELYSDNQVGPKISVKKNVFKIVGQVWNFSPFKLLPMWLDAVIHVPLPLLVTLSKTFNRNAATYCQWLSLNLCHVTRMPHFQIQIHPWDKRKLQAARSDEWGGGDGRQLPFCFVAKREIFADDAEVQQESLAALHSISVEGFRRCFQQWERHWDCCIQSWG